MLVVVGIIKVSSNSAASVNQRKRKSVRRRNRYRFGSVDIAGGGCIIAPLSRAGCRRARQDVMIGHAYHFPCQQISHGYDVLDSPSLTRKLLRHVDTGDVAFSFTGT